MKLFKKKEKKEKKKEIENMDLFEELMRDNWDDDIYGVWR